MNILFLSHTPLVEGKGTQRFFIEIGNYLHRQGHSVTLVENEQEQLVNESRVEISHKPEFTSRKVQFIKKRMFYILPPGIVSENYDIIYVSSFNYLPLIPASNQNIIFGMHVVYPQTVFIRNVLNRVKFRLKEVLFALLIVNRWNKGSNNIVFHALNLEQSQWIHKVTNGKYPTIILPNPVECPKNSQDEKTQIICSFRILYFGSLSEGKGFGTFFKIYHALKDILLNRKDKVEFVVAGDGPMRDIARRESETTSNFSYIVRPDDSAKLNLFSSCDVLVYPSTLDNFPYLVVEAQIMGLPVIATDIPGVRDIILQDETGKLIEQNDQSSFVRQVLEYINMKNDNPYQYKKMRDIIANLSKRYCSKNVLPQYLDLFNKILEGKAI